MKYRTAIATATRNGCRLASVPADSGRARAWTCTRALLLAAAATVLAAVATPAPATTISMDNWRSIYMNGHYPNGGSNEQVFLYALHTPRQENLLASFDVSGYAGQMVLGDGTMTFTVTGSYNTSNTLELYQLNAYNGDVDLDSSGSFYKDSPDATPGTQRWRNNAGAELSHLNYNNSVFDITSALLATATGNPQIGAQVSFTIAQSDLQQWLDGLLPSTVVMTMDNVPWSYYYFTPDATLSFETDGVSAGASTPLPAPTTLGLLAGALLFAAFQSRRRARPGDSARLLDTPRSMALAC